MIGLTFQKGLSSWPLVATGRQGGRRLPRSRWEGTMAGRGQGGGQEGAGRAPVSRVQQGCAAALLGSAFRCTGLGVPVRPSGNVDAAAGNVSPEPIVRACSPRSL